MITKDPHQVVEAKPEPGDNMGSVPKLSFREQLQYNIRALEQQRDALMAQVNSVIGSLNAYHQSVELYDKEQAGAGEGKT